MTELPKSLTPYKKTAMFTSENVPKPFLKEHTTAEGVWGVLNITQGALIFCDDETGKEYPLSKANQMVISPQKKHHLKLNGHAEFYVTFYRE